MAGEAEFDRVSATLNERRLAEFDAQKVQQLVSGYGLSVDDGGGLHDESGARVGCLRRAPSGEWIVEPQNTAAHNADAAMPSPAPGGEQLSDN